MSKSRTKKRSFEKLFAANEQLKFDGLYDHPIVKFMSGLKMRCHYCDVPLHIIHKQWRVDKEGNKQSSCKFQPFGATLDHVTPYCDSGSNEMENYVVCCSRCNGLRGNLSYFEYALWAEFYLKDFINKPHIHKNDQRKFVKFRKEFFGSVGLE